MRIKSILGVALIALLPLLSSFPAYAISDYDNVYQTIDHLEVSKNNYYSATCTPVDFTNNWAEDILNKTLRDSNNIPNQKLQDFRTAFNTGSYSVSQVIMTESSTGGMSKYIRVMYATDNVNLVWSGGVGVWMDVGSAPAWGQFNIDINDSNGCADARIIYQDSNDPIALLYPNSSYYTVKNFGVRNVNQNLPLNYEGETVTTLSSTVTPIRGSVQCGWGNTVITDVSVDPASGVAGDATLTEALGGKQYEYYLTEPSSYRLLVVCDGEIASTPVIYDYTQTYDFVCTHEGYLGYICSES